MSRFVQIVHREEFAAAHRLHSPHLGEAENQALYGPCYTLHGHNYAVEVTVRGPLDPRTGMVMDLNRLMQTMREQILAHVDHRYLNEDVDFLRDLIPTAENLAVAFWERLEPHVPAAARLQRVRVIESQQNFVDYYGEDR